MKSQVVAFSMAFFVSLAGAVVLTHPGLANAFWWRQPGANCLGPVAHVMGGSFYNQSQSSHVWVDCPVLDSDLTPANRLRMVGIDGFDGSTSEGVAALACVKFWNATGSSCGASVATPAADVKRFSLSPPITPFSRVGDYPYVSVRLPARQAEISSIDGYYGREL